MSRLPNWECKLNAWVEKSTGRKFEWGQFDCALAAASCVEAITGKHPRPDLIGAYHTPLGAYRVIEANGGLSGICDALYTEINPKSVMRGDAVLGELDGKQTLMIFTGNKYTFMAGGLMLVTDKDVNILKAWRVE